MQLECPVKSIHLKPLLVFCLRELPEREHESGLSSEELADTSLVG